MPIRQEMQKAIKAILDYQNKDGGIPATNPGDNSGAWTTASCLESFLLCPYTPIKYYPAIKTMTEFLSSAQLMDGGWPLIDSDASCTMATGHAVTALQLARQVFEHDEVLASTLDLAITRGFKWIATHQNQDGGWGVEPAGGIAGQLTRLAATAYALRPYWVKGVRFGDSTVVRDAVSYLERTQRLSTDGGWAYTRGDTREDFSDPSNTARAVAAILRSGHLASNSPEIRKAIAFITSQKLPGTSWRLGLESFVLEYSPTQNVYHNNGPCDALEALLIAGHFDQTTNEAFWWLLRSQKEHGVWHLSSPDPSQRFSDVWTWSTSEFIHVMSLASATYIRHVLSESPGTLKPPTVSESFRQLIASFSSRG